MSAPLPTLENKTYTLLILPDQLSIDNAGLHIAKKERDTLIFIETKEILDKLSYPYHRHRLILLMSAMRHYAKEKEKEGWKIEYHTLKETHENNKTFLSIIKNHCLATGNSIIVTQPNSYDEQLIIENIDKKLKEEKISLHLVPTKQFICSREDFFEYTKNKRGGDKHLLMEYFYREMRRWTGLLMEETTIPIPIPTTTTTTTNTTTNTTTTTTPTPTPMGGKWNYDANNRATFSDWKKAGKPKPEKSIYFKQDELTKEVIEDIKEVFPTCICIGKSEDFNLPVTRKEALSCLNDFIKYRLVNFGTWQDLMVEGDEEEIKLFHSILSPALNIGLLTPLECAKAAEEAYKNNEAPLPAVEGFIRQIIGWREFVNGVYWLKMPDYISNNGLNATKSLPSFFKTGETNMNCLATVLKETHKNGFNHHIQRLMILGNFILLSGINPQEALEWFNAMYVDAHDWVMAANVIGMALHADNGYMATKPYCSSGAYINKMSNYCKSCVFKPNIKTGEGACPFNLLYWNFHNTHQEMLSKNPRTSMTIQTWQSRSQEDRDKVIEEANLFLIGLL